MDSVNASGIGNPKSRGIVEEPSNNNSYIYVMTNE
jgi:hypothetical protein